MSARPIDLQKHPLMPGHRIAYTFDQGEFEGQIVACARVGGKYVVTIDWDDADDVEENVHKQLDVQDRIDWRLLSHRFAFDPTDYVSLVKFTFGHDVRNFSLNDESLRLSFSHELVKRGIGKIVVHPVESSDAYAIKIKCMVPRCDRKCACCLPRWSHRAFRKFVKRHVDLVDDKKQIDLNTNTSVTEQR